MWSITDDVFHSPTVSWWRAALCDRLPPTVDFVFFVVDGNNEDVCRNEETRAEEYLGATAIPEQ